MVLTLVSVVAILSCGLLPGAKALEQPSNGAHNKKGTSGISYGTYSWDGLSNHRFRNSGKTATRLTLRLIPQPLVSLCFNALML